MTNHPYHLASGWEDAMGRGRRGGGQLLAAGAVGLAAVAVGLYAARRRLIARLLGLPPAPYSVAVERGLPVPMRDGATLKADHYFPKAPGSFPTILLRTPYGRGSDLPLPLGLVPAFQHRRLAERGYHVVAQTVRGRLDSAGTFNPFFDEADDGRATLEWLREQPWFDGALGMMGPSYLGYVQWATVAADPDAVRALVPHITAAHLGSLVYPDGAFGLDLTLRWISTLAILVSKGQDSAWSIVRQLNPTAMDRRLARAFNHLPLRDADIAAVGHPVSYYRDWLAHPGLADPYWRSVDQRASIARTTAPVHLIGGWYDIFLRELLADYARLRDAGRIPYLTIGPWWHSDQRGLNAALRETIVWNEAYLKGNPSLLRRQPVRLYVMGADEWRELESWPPPARETPYFLQGAGGLSTEQPAADASPDHYRYDPADPTPSVGGPLLIRPPAGPRDNRALEARPDVLLYTTPPLTADLDIIGPVRLELYVQSSLDHTDVFGRVCDVHPDGRSVNICDGLVRLETGDGAARPDGSRRITIGLWATAHRFARGHRLRLQVSSGAHPRWSRNLGTGEPIATGTRMLPADQAVYHDRAHPSALILPVTPHAAGATPG